MQDNDVIDLVDLPDNFKPIVCKWAFNAKMDSKHNME